MNTQSLYWSVRRELWENRSIYVAPIVVAAVTLFAYLISTFVAPNTPAKHYLLAAVLLMATMFVVGIFYCLDALHGERRDRSILFWKSMPVSDWTTVLAKMAIPIVILPVVTFVITFAVQFLMLMMNSAALIVTGRHAAAPWGEVLGQAPMLLYHLVTVHALYYAPIFGWLLLVSAWARRMPILWALLPLAVIGIMERMAFQTSYFGHMLGARISGNMKEMPGAPPLGHFMPLDFLSDPGLWIGFLIAAVFLCGAVRLRRYRGPI